MFKELAPMLKKGDTFVLTVSRTSDTELSVTVSPRLFTLDGERGADRKALNTPVQITGTIEELDSPDFVAQLDRFTGSVTGLRHSLEEAEATHQSARAKVKTKGAEKTKDKDKTDGTATGPAAPAELESETETKKEEEPPEPKKPAHKASAEELTKPMF